ncbi:MAG: S8 family serine peptidase [Spirochaetota bacterium]
MERHFFILIVLLTTVLPAAGIEEISRKGKKSSILSSSLSEVTGGTARSTEQFRREYPMRDGAMVLHARVNGKRDRADTSADIVRAGGIITGESKDIIEFSIAPDTIRLLEGMSGVAHIGPAMRAIPLVIEGENVVLTKASNMHTNGYDGRGIKVGIIDLGFYSNTQAIAAGELPSTVITRDFTGTGFEASADGVHGTAVAEVVHEMAPAAQLYLCKVRYSLELQQAYDYCKSMGAHIINHSAAWVGASTGRGDGPICAIVNDAYSNNILWVNAAGNHAQMHWQGTYSDANADELHDFSGTSYVNTLGPLAGGQVVNIVLTWDDVWGASTNDYDLLLLRWNGSAWSLVAISEDTQNGDDNPVEGIVGTIGTAGTYAVAVGKYSGEAKKLRIFNLSAGNLTYKSTAGSVTTPSDAKHAFAVGAINYANWPSGPQESYSSLGPTVDGRLKPEICGVDNNTNYMYVRFTGTSSASPCVAGAAAVIWSAYQNCAARDVWNALIHYARDLGPAGPDNTYGYGAVNIEVVKRFAAINNAYRGVGDIIIDQVPQGTVIRIYAVSGKIVTALRVADASGSARWNVRNAGGTAVAPGVYYCTVQEPSGVMRTTRIMITRSRYQ